MSISIRFLALIKPLAVSLPPWNFVSRLKTKMCNYYWFSIVLWLSRPTCHTNQANGSANWTLCLLVQTVIITQPFPTIFFPWRIWKVNDYFNRQHSTWYLEDLQSLKLVCGCTGTTWYCSKEPTKEKGQYARATLRLFHFPKYTLPFCLVIFSWAPSLSNAWTYFHVITAEKWTDGCEILVLQKYKIPSVLVFRSQPAHYFHNTDKNSEQVKYSCRHASMHNGWILLQHNDKTMTASRGKSGLLVLTPLWEPVLKSKGLHKIPWLQAQVKPIARTCSEASMSAL